MLCLTMDKKTTITIQHAGETLEIAIPKTEKLLTMARLGFTGPPSFVIVRSDAIVKERKRA